MLLFYLLSKFLLILSPLSFRFKCIANATNSTTLMKRFSWNKLALHPHRLHVHFQDHWCIEITPFKITQGKKTCWLCDFKDICCKKKILIHLNNHFKQREKVCCPFSGCSFETNLLEHFRSYELVESIYAETDSGSWGSQQLSIIHWLHTQWEGSCWWPQKRAFSIKGTQHGK